jgi:hypothetical protein
MRTFVFVVAALLAGCTSQVFVKPTEIPKLSGARELVSTVESFQMGYGYGYGFGGRRGGMGLAPSYGVMTTRSFANLETVDGRIESLPAVSSFDLVFVDGGVLRFDPPLDARIEGEDLVIASQNRTRAAYPLATIHHAEFERVEAGKTFALVMGIGFGVAAVGVAVPLLTR